MKHDLVEIISYPFVPLRYMPDRQNTNERELYPIVVKHLESFGYVYGENMRIQGSQGWYDIQSQQDKGFVRLNA